MTNSPADPDDLRYRPVLDRLRADIRESEADEQSCKARLAELRRSVALMRASAAALARMLGDEAEPAPVQPSCHADAVERVFRVAGRPMRAPEIVSWMEAEGYALPADEGRRAGAVYSAMMRRPGVFVKVSRGLYALREEGR